MHKIGSHPSTIFSAREICIFSAKDVSATNFYVFFYSHPKKNATLFHDHILC